MASKVKYTCPWRIEYFSQRYRKQVTVPLGYPSDGATGGVDLFTFAWWVHDVLCDRGTWDDGTPCTNWQASCVIGDILKSEGRWCRARTWKWATFLFGGGKARENGMFKLKNES